MNPKRRWSPPGWPWELELLALVFVLTAIIVPYYLEVSQTPDQREMTLLEQAELARKSEMQGTWREGTHFIWAIAIICLYLAHVVMAGASLNYVSTPFTHLFAPLIFSGITYYRLLKLGGDAPHESPLVKGTLLEVFMWFLGVVVITFLVARIRMARHMLNFKDIDWEVSTGTLFDSTFSQLALRIQPLIYPPRVYRVCDEGLIVEGWLYVLPIPFNMIQSIERIQRAGFLSSGYYLATSTRTLVRVQLTENPEPIFISPAELGPFLRYCRQRVTAFRPDTRSVETVVEVE